MNTDIISIIYQYSKINEMNNIKNSCELTDQNIIDMIKNYNIPINKIYELVRDEFEKDRLYAKYQNTKELDLWESILSIKSNTIFNIIMAYDDYDLKYFLSITVCEESRVQITNILSEYKFSTQHKLISDSDYIEIHELCHEEMQLFTNKMNELKSEYTSFINNKTKLLSLFNFTFYQ